MENLLLEEELLVQRKIDNTLSEHEEALFNKLIETSQEARKFYHDLLKVHQQLEKDARKGPFIHFSKEIIDSITRTKNHTIINQQSYNIHQSKSTLRLLSYAAILIIGIVVGSLASYFRQANITRDYQQLSGTMMEKQPNYFYHNRGTEIKIDEFKNDELKFAIFTVNTLDTIKFCISGNNEISDKNLTLLFSNGSFHREEVENNDLKYSCTGKAVFQISTITTKNSTNAFDIQFFAENREIKKLRINELQ